MLKLLPHPLVQTYDFPILCAYAWSPDVDYGIALVWMYLYLVQGRWVQFP